MSLLLRLASSIDKRPNPVISDIRVTFNEDSIYIKLLPKESNKEILLEKWSLMNCGSVLREITSYELIVV